MTTETELREEIASLTAREELCRAIAENSPAMLWMGATLGYRLVTTDHQDHVWRDLALFDTDATGTTVDDCKHTPPCTDQAEHTRRKVEDVRNGR